ncbi:SulP family inorganic anion transporter [Streptomyces sp. NPDC001282]|uniref:SulP family inorganic anion transporter n=1 Tax=Streptomyces sp. NPDC001282 TaxID=3364557 RepID=UPI0036D048D6
MSACVPARHDRASRSSRPPRSSGVKRPHSPPSSPRGGPRLRISGADLSASITVFLLAVPMSLGLAVAMNAPLTAGLISAAIGGIVAGLLGGTPLQVSGPSAGLTVVTAELIQIYGWRTTCAITIGAGLLQIVLGSLRAARSALAVSPAIVHGTLAGIGVAIALAQLHIVLGGSPQSSAVSNILALPDQLGRVSPSAPLIGMLTITVLVLWPRTPGRLGRTVRRVPTALAAVVSATVVAGFATPGIARVDLPSWRSHALPELPHGPVLALATAVFTVMLVASLESLLAAVAVDKLTADRFGGRAADRNRGTPSSPPVSATSTAPTLSVSPGDSAAATVCAPPAIPSEPASADSPGPPAGRSDLDRELRAQGIANTLSGLVGGLAVSGGAVRSSANVRAGATSRASTVLHGIWVVLATGLLVAVLELIPLAALAALVMMVGIQMVSFAHIRNVHKHREFLVYGATITGVILFGVLKGVAIGIAVAVVVALHRLARTRITVTDQDGRHLVVVRGQLTFLAVPRLSRTFGRLPQDGDVVVELDGFFMDHAAYETIQDWSIAQRAHGGRVVFTGRSGSRIAEPASAAHSCCSPWTPWRNHHCHDRSDQTHGLPEGGGTPPCDASEPHVATAPDSSAKRAFHTYGATARAPGPDAFNSPHRGTADGVPPGSDITPGAPPSSDATPDGLPGIGRGHRSDIAAGVIRDRGPGISLDQGPGQGADHGRGSDPTACPLATDPGPAPVGPAAARPVAGGDNAPAPVGASTACLTSVGGRRQAGGNRLVSGLSTFQRHTAPLVRKELARLAREGQHPSQLFITCADSRLVTSMITASGPGDLFTVRNIGNLVPPPNTESGDDSVGAAIEYAVEVLGVDSITICGHSGCGAMQALLDGTRTPDTPQTSLWRWLRHGLPSLKRMASRRHPWARISGRLPTDAVEQLCLTNVVQQLEHLRAHESVARRLSEGTLQLHGMYFHVGEAQAYLLTGAASVGIALDEVFDRVGPGDADAAPGISPGGPGAARTQNSSGTPGITGTLSRPGAPGRPGAPSDPEGLERTGV